MTLRELLSGGGQRALDTLADVGSRIRYGVPFDEKARMALTGMIPGARKENLRSEVGSDIEQRRAAAYLFGQQWPTMGPEWQPLIDRYVRSGDDPRLLAVTQDAVEQGSRDALMRDANARYRVR